MTASEDSAPEPFDPVWRVEHRSGSARELHALDLATLSEGRRAVWIFEVDGPALVLGSTQDSSSVDRSRADELAIDVVERASGGGAVLLVPGGHVWIDVVLPRHDELWQDDVSKSGLWLASVWRAALSSLGVETDVFTGQMCNRLLGSLVCFAAVAAGEVTVGEAKVVGMSQRRTREAARFQCVVHTAFDIEPMIDLLAPVIDGSQASALRSIAVGTVAAEASSVQSSFLGALEAHAARPR